MDDRDTTSTSYTVVANNVFYHADGNDCVDAPYVQSDALFNNWFVSCSDDVAAHNDADGTASISGGTVHASGRVASSVGMDELYSDWDGPDGMARTLSDNDLTVATDDAAFLGDGYELADTDCGTYACPAQDSDMNGDERT